MIASDPICKDGNVRLTTVTFKARCLIKYELDMDVRLILKTDILNCGFSTKVTSAFLLQENM